jgi:hypothetical protein
MELTLAQVALAAQVLFVFGAGNRASNLYL